MSRTTASIMRINQELDKISGLDGIVADKVEAIEKEVREMVSDVLRNHSEASFFNRDGVKENEKFTWSEKEDEELYKNGITIMIVAGRTKAIQRFVEDLSYKIGHKCDFAFSGGRAHIDVSKDGCEKAIECINDETFMKKYVVPYSEESYEKETYFEVLK